MQRACTTVCAGSCLLNLLPQSFEVTILTEQFGVETAPLQLCKSSPALLAGLTSTQVPVWCPELSTAGAHGRQSGALLWDSGSLVSGDTLAVLARHSNFLLLKPENGCGGVCAGRFLTSLPPQHSVMPPFRERRVSHNTDARLHPTGTDL